MFRVLFLRVLVVAALIGIAGPSLAADYTIDSSNIPDLAAGQKIAPGSTISIPAGGKLVLLDTNDHQIFCEQKYSGPAKNCLGKPTCPLWKRVIGQCASSTVKGGGNKAGGVRGVSK